MNAALLVLGSFILTILGVMALAIGHDNLSALVLAIPAVWLLPKGRVASWLLLVSLALYGYGLEAQPVSLAVSVWMLLPVLDVIFAKKGSWQLGMLMAVISLSMYGGLMALQRDGKLEGDALYTSLQLLSVVGVWFAARSWRPIEGNTWWPIATMVPLWIAGSAHGALVGMCVVSLIAALQTIGKLKEQQEWIVRMSWLLPSVGFATLVVVPHWQVPNAVLVCWLLVLCSAWMGEYLLEDPEEDF